MWPSGHRVSVVRRTADRAKGYGSHDGPARAGLPWRARLRALPAAEPEILASIAFRVFLFPVPLTLTLVGIAGYPSLRLASDESPWGSRRRLPRPARLRRGDPFRASFTMLTTASSLFSTLSRSSAQLWEMWDYQPTPALRRVRFLGGLLLTLVILLVGRWIRTSAALAVVVHITSIAVHGALALLLAFFPTGDALARPPAWRAVATAGLVGLNVFAVVRLPHKLASLSETYGALGVAVVTLGYLVLLGYLLRRRSSPTSVARVQLSR
jgi:hypothetical protein